jgi:hypothetical protein
MRAVFFAAMLAGTSTWLLVATDWREPVTAAARTTAAQPLGSVRSLYRMENIACQRAAPDERTACERRARHRLHAAVRREAGQLSLR